MRKQRPATEAEKDFDAKVAEFNREAQKIMGDRSLPISARRRLISSKGKSLLRRPGVPAANPQGDQPR